MFVQAIPPTQKSGGGIHPPPPGIYASGIELYEEFHRKTVYIHFGKLFKLLKYKDNKKMCDTFDYNLGYIPFMYN